MASSLPLLEYQTHVLLSALPSVSQHWLDSPPSFVPPRFLALSGSLRRPQAPAFQWTPIDYYDDLLHLCCHPGSLEETFTGAHWLQGCWFSGNRLQVKCYCTSLRVENSVTRSVSAYLPRLAVRFLSYLKVLRSCNGSGLASILF